MIELGRRLILGAALACSAGAALPGCRHRGVTKPPVVQPTPPPSTQIDIAALPPKGQPARLEMLIRQTAARLHTIDGKPVQWFQAIQCCGGADGTVLPPGSNTRWPLASESWMDYAHSMGANAFHFRLGPFYGDAENEAEWADIGGPIKADGTWNDAFWQKTRELAWHAAKLNAYVEVVVIDTWYGKHAASNWGDQKMPWPQADIDACGKTMTPTQEAFVRKAVSELGGFGNVIWATDNEGDQINGNRREWFEAVARIIRDEEAKSAGNVVHLIGTNSDHYDSGAFDFAITHARAPLTEPLAGKWTLNNERNPSLGPDQEAAYFAQAREKGLGWALWLANLQGDQVRRVFEGFKAVAGGGQASGCFAPPEDDPKWQPGPVQGCPNEVLSALAAAKAAYGDPRERWRACQSDANLQPEDRTPIACMFPTLDALAQNMRDQGLCAGRTRDAITAKPSGRGTLWYEIHATGATDGGYTGTPCKGSTWSYPQ